MAAINTGVAPTPCRPPRAPIKGAPILGSTHATFPLSFSLPSPAPMTSCRRPSLHRPALRHLLALHQLHPRHETSSSSMNRTSRVSFSPLFGSLMSSKGGHHCAINSEHFFTGTAPSVLLPALIKGLRSTPGHHHTQPHPPLPAPESATPTSPSTDRRQPSPCVMPSFPHLPSSDEPTNVLAATSSTSPAPSPATLSPGVVGGQALLSSRDQPWCRSMVNRRRPWSTNCGLGPQVFRQQNNSLKILFPGTLHLSP
jgi:hypothetical protein